MVRILKSAFNRPQANIRKVGGIWFARAWRIRISFCIAGEG